MVKSNITEQDKKMIQDLEITWFAYQKVLSELQNNASDKVQVATHMLQTPLHKYAMTWDFVDSLTVDERKKLFDDILDCAADWNSPCQERAFNQIINELPRDWVLENLEETFSPLLEEYLDEAYRSLLYIYEQLDFSKAIHWAKIAFSHEDIEIKLVGKDWLEDNNVDIGDV